MTKIAVSSLGSELESNVNPRFGRSLDFLIVDSETMNFIHIDNSRVNEMTGGAGIKTAEMLIEQGVDIVLTGFVGPKASQALNMANVKFYDGYDGMTVKEAVKNFKSL